MDEAGEFEEILDDFVVTAGEGTEEVFDFTSHIARLLRQARGERMDAFDEEDEDGSEFDTDDEGIICITP